ncbi:MAG: ABC transporter substrate-binding protein [Beijerinckiaceae bacterium]|nr:ABC transporter substrate-binding protein [Beijerinckiaceae bacterium]MCZ8300393.1 ABC transporter substrate-binding protein [Beijerinckiaceae bacterium]
MTKSRHPQFLQLGLSRREVGGLALGAATIAAFIGSKGASAQAANSLNLAMIGEPQTLDPMASTADLPSLIMMHVYESLYTFDQKLNARPMLAVEMPKVSADGLTYDIDIRKGVKLHSGRDLDVEDVIASLKRWIEMTPRGKSVGAALVSIDAKGTHGLTIKLKSPVPALVTHMALPSGYAAIMAKESIATPLVNYIGTGPYRFKERKPDQFVILTRFDGYSARSEAPDGYAGKREAKVAELRFIPVPNANTRVEGAIAGQYHFADQLPVEAFRRVTDSGSAKPILMMPYGFPYLVTNTKQGLFADKKIRQAFQLALNEGEMLGAAFGDEKFYRATPAHFPQSSPFHSMAGEKVYNKADAAGAKKLLAEAKYDGTPVRILNSKQYEFHHAMALVMAENLKAAGFKTQLDVVDWATLVQRRADPALYEVYITHSSFYPEPMLSPPQLGAGAPGWWDSPAKNAAISAFNAESDPVKRGALWAKVQEVVYDEVPYIRVGEFAALCAGSMRLTGYVPMPMPAFWNVSLG